MTGPPLADMLEREWQRQVVQLFRQLGWSGYHTHDSRRSQPGFPDIVLVRERVVYLELKRENGALSAPQALWLSRLLSAGAECYLARPRHLEALAAILAARWPLDQAHDTPGRVAAVELLAETREQAQAAIDRNAAA